MFGVVGCRANEGIESRHDSGDEQIATVLRNTVAKQESRTGLQLPNAGGDATIPASERRRILSSF
jgi:hypothetical protein